MRKIFFVATIILFAFFRVSNSYAISSSIISGTIFTDTDQNGIQEKGENGVSNVQVVAKGRGFTLSATANKDGIYTILIPAQGTYQVTFKSPTSPQPITKSVFISRAIQKATVNFGILPSQSILFQVQSCDLPGGGCCDTPEAPGIPNLCHNGMTCNPSTLKCEKTSGCSSSDSLCCYFNAAGYYCIGANYSCNTTTFKCESTCGGANQACCGTSPNETCNQGLVCASINGRTCQPCGGNQQFCCSNSSCNGSGLTCSNFVCQCPSGQTWNGSSCVTQGGGAPGPGGGVQTNCDKLGGVDKCSRDYCNPPTTVCSTSNDCSACINGAGGGPSCSANDCDSTGAACGQQANQSGHFCVAGEPGFYKCCKDPQNNCQYKAVQDNYCLGELQGQTRCDPATNQCVPIPSPQITIQSPISGATFKEGASVPIKVSIQNCQGIDSVPFYVDGALVDYLADKTNCVFEKSWTAQRGPNPQRVIKVEAYDNGQKKDEKSVTITVTQAQQYSVTGTVYVDTNGNGVIDTGEGKPNVAIDIGGSGLTPNPSTVTTDSGGKYSFTAISSQGNYSIFIHVPSSHTLTNPSTNPSTFFVTQTEPSATINFRLIPISTNTPTPTLSPTPTVTPTITPPGGGTATSAASITTDKQEYKVGDPIKICIKVPVATPQSPTRVKIIDVLPSGSAQLFQDYFESQGQRCFDSQITPPTGKECLRLEYSGAAGSGTRETCFNVISATATSTPTKTPTITPPGGGATTTPPVGGAVTSTPSTPPQGGVTSTPTPTSTPTTPPGATATPTPTQGPLPTIPCDEQKGICPTVTPTPTLPPGASPFPTTSISPLSFTISVRLPGIGKGLGDNPTPNRKSRKAEVVLLDLAKKEVGRGGGTVTFDEFSDDMYVGKVTVTGVAPGTYFVKVRLDNTLFKLIPEEQELVASGGFLIRRVEAVKIIPTVELISGDLDQNNRLDLRDYNILIGCFGNKLCAKKQLADLNDDRRVEEKDVNILLRGFAIQTEGD